MSKRKTKRTAGERRYRALKRKADHAVTLLREAQWSMTESESKGVGVKSIYIMNKITEAREKLNG